jgi:hypothetical protein
MLSGCAKDVALGCRPVGASSGRPLCELRCTVEEAFESGVRKVTAGDVLVPTVGLEVPGHHRGPLPESVQSRPLAVCQSGVLRESS